MSLDAFTPTPAQLQWFQATFARCREGATWRSPGSGHLYRISHADRTLTLLDGDPGHEWHGMNAKCMEAIGWTMVTPASRNAIVADPTGTGKVRPR